MLPDIDSVLSRAHFPFKLISVPRFLYHLIIYLLFIGRHVLKLIQQLYKRHLSVFLHKLFGIIGAWAELGK